MLQYGQGIVRILTQTQLMSADMPARAATPLHALGTIFQNGLSLSLKLMM
jgi:hypothetical protein